MSLQQQPQTNTLYRISSQNQIILYQLKICYTYKKTQNKQQTTVTSINSSQSNLHEEIKKWDPIFVPHRLPNVPTEAGETPKPLSQIVMAPPSSSHHSSP